MTTQQEDFPFIVTDLHRALYEMQSLRKKGWHSVNLPDHVVVGKEWLKENTTGRYKSISRFWVFENEEDATMFVLRWS